jgi:methylenetetrahydrofolate dehydrogenase (NADP+)/methenyltetrahydrofolate cyclohydrolase
MPASILDGRRVAQQVRSELEPRIASLRARGVVARLSLLRVGEDPASAVYVRTKAKACAELGIDSEVCVLPADAPAGRIAEEIDRRSADPAVHGILLQLPLPGGVDPLALLSRIDPEKDVDGFHPINIGRLCLGTPGFVPCTPLGIVELLRRHDIGIAGSHVAVIGRSTTVGRPLANLLSLKGSGFDATVSVLHSRTREPWKLARQADIVVAAAGSRGLVDASWIRPGAVVVDVGIHRGDDGKLTGDVDAASVRETAGWLSPVPGGVGPMTVACLLVNTVQSAENHSRRVA